ncbi:helix-turn-helix transcriptional regulator [Sphingobacterium sp.]|uniref:helix-turn-helix transcriptional regulator n=1 Tax=Sphingobacterium sp. TaxID=341027 RepID=UPI0028A78FB2|nr:helix-turn-helix transcriptional regulator [Sphingobacterium sp.]
MLIIMQHKQINRLKAVLADTNRTNKWLAERLGKSETTISRWCTNEVQPSIETMVQIAQLLNIDIKDLLNSSK